MNEASPDWLDGAGLTVRTENVLRSAGLTDPDAVFRATDSDLLRTKNFGRRCLDELRSKGLRRDSCEPGCVLPREHAGLHVSYDSRYAHAMRTGRWRPVGPEPSASDLVAYLQARPDMAVEVVRSLRVVGAWESHPDQRGGDRCRRRLDGSVAVVAYCTGTRERVEGASARGPLGWDDGHAFHPALAVDEAVSAADAALIAAGWSLAGGKAS